MDVADFVRWMGQDRIEYHSSIETLSKENAQLKEALRRQGEEFGKARQELVDSVSKLANENAQLREVQLSAQAPHPDKTLAGDVD